MEATGAGPEAAGKSHEEKLADRLICMGFDASKVERALFANNWNVDDALEHLLAERFDTQTRDTEEEEESDMARKKSPPGASRSSGSQTTVPDVNLKSSYDNEKNHEFDSSQQMVDAVPAPTDEDRIERTQQNVEPSPQGFCRTCGAKVCDVRSGGLFRSRNETRLVPLDIPGVVRMGRCLHCHPDPADNAAHGEQTTRRNGEESQNIVQRDQQLQQQPGAFLIRAPSAGASDTLDGTQQQSEQDVESQQARLVIPNARRVDNAITAAALTPQQSSQNHTSTGDSRQENAASFCSPGRKKWILISLLLIVLVAIAVSVLALLLSRGSNPSGQEATPPGSSVGEPPNDSPPAPQSTQAPVPNPTAAPVPQPTQAPVPQPTAAPVPNPTEVPVPQPTRASVPQPTQAPVPNPTGAPVPNPTLSPTRQPTTSPTRRPTREPTLSPTRNPTRRPTRQPTKDPTSPPTTPPPTTRPPTTFPPTTRPPTTPAPTTLPPTSQSSNEVCVSVVTGGTTQCGFNVCSDSQWSDPVTKNTESGLWYDRLSVNVYFLDARGDENIIEVHWMDCIRCYVGNWEETRPTRFELKAFAESEESASCYECTGRTEGCIEYNYHSIYSTASCTPVVCPQPIEQWYD